MTLVEGLAVTMILYGSPYIGWPVVIISIVVWFITWFYARKVVLNQYEQIVKEQGKPKLILHSCIVHINGEKQEREDLCVIAKGIILSDLDHRNARFIPFSTISAARVLNQNSLQFMAQGIGELRFICNNRMKVRLLAKKLNLNMESGKEYEKQESN